MTNMFMPFPGYEDRFEIAVDGRVRSIGRRVNSPVAGGSRFIPSRPLRVRLIKGYPAIQARIGGVSKTLYLHRAIALLLVPNPEGKPHINHKDGDKTNFAPSNLEWCTHAENMAHAYETGLASALVVGPGEDCPAAKLTEADVVDIKQRVQAGETQRSIARSYKVSQGTIGFIARGVTWAHVTLEGACRPGQ